MQVTLTFGRRTDDGIEYYEVRLMRGTAEYFNSLDASLRKQTELESLRAQIRDASTVELKDREDNERLKEAGKCLFRAVSIGPTSDTPAVSG
jgi:hypothetical protein